MSPGTQLNAAVFSHAFCPSVSRETSLCIEKVTRGRGVGVGDGGGWSRRGVVLEDGIWSGKRWGRGGGLVAWRSIPSPADGSG